MSIEDSKRIEMEASLQGRSHHWFESVADTMVCQADKVRNKNHLLDGSATTTE